MTDLYNEIDGLSDEQRELLELLLQDQARQDPDTAIEQLLASLTASDAGVETGGGVAARQQEFPLSFSQQRLWFLDQVDPGSSLYNIPSAFRLSGKIDRTIFVKCIDEIVARHQSLRTTFPVVDGEPVQEIHPTMEIPIEYVGLQQLPRAQREAQALHLARQHARQPFDLASGPLLRFALYQLEPDEHIGLLTMHHIISDGWSMGIFIKELISLYQVLSRGLPASASGLQPLTYHYADYAVWQRRWMQSHRLQDDLEYWKSKLGGELPILQLPGDHPRPAVSSGRGSSLTFSLSQHLLQTANLLASQEGATLFMVLLSAYFALLNRSSGQEDICIGTPIANRSRAEVEEIIGFFINTLVLRLQIDGPTGARTDAPLTFRQLVQRVRETALQAYAHQELPFDILVEELHPERDSSYSPLFQTMFVLQNTPLQAVRLPGLAFEQIELHTGDAKFDLTMALAQDKGILSGVLEYSTDLFEDSSMRCLVGHFQTLLESALSDPDQPLADLPLLTSAEWREIVVDWNETAAEYPRKQCLHQAFQSWVARQPAAAAVVYQEESLTYGELDRRSNQLAHCLKNYGVGPDVPVAIYMDRSPDLITALLGVLKAGGAYVPLDPLYPPQRLALMLDDILQACSSAGASPVLITRSALRHALPAPTGASQPLTVLYVDSDQQLSSQPESPPEIEAAATATTSKNLAYILYTSGSTGMPKGVCLQHQGAINLLADFERRAPLSAGSRCSWWTSLNFDVSVYEIFTPLLVGGALYIVPEETRPESEKFFDWMHENQIHSAYIPPFMIGDYKSWLIQQSRNAAAFSLRRLLVGVEPIHEQLLAEINHYIPDLQILNGYGPTEATVCCTLFAIQPDQAQNRNAPIGKPTANTQIYVLDPNHLRPVPVGVAGELYVGGDGLARGYINRPDLTAERFIPNPFAPSLSPRLYKTGDVVRYLADGNLEFIGRADFQVKLHGFRIELGEIEAALSLHPGVRKSVVLLREPDSDRTELPFSGELPFYGSRSPSASKDKRLVAYVVSPADEGLTAGELRRFLKERLPDYMLPSAFVILESLPITPNGKVDRRALPAPYYSQDLQERERLIEPRNPVEQKLVEIWSALLGINPGAGAAISVDDNFFDLGGHSLLATQMNTRIREIFQVDISLREFFSEPTIEFLAQRIATGKAVPVLTIPPYSSGVELKPGDVSPPRQAPLSFSQQRMWLLHQIDPLDAAYNIPLALRLQGELDCDALQDCMNALVSRHETLRTTFRAESGIPVQVIAPHAILPENGLIAFEDLSTLSGGEKSAALLAALLVQKATRPFDLQSGPLLRCLLLRLTPDEHVLLLVMHHIISDGWSMSLLLEEISALYRARVSQIEAQLPALLIQYADYAVWQREHLSGDTLKRLQDYWVEKLSGIPASLELPYDRPRPPVQTARGAHLAFSLGRDILAGLKDLSQQTKSTLFITLLAAFQALLHRYSGQADICVGTPIANRNQKEVENLVGCFINTLVIRAGFSAQCRFREILTQVRDSALEAYAHQDFPFEKLVDALQPERDMGRTPLFQVMFILQTAQQTAQQTAPVTAINLPGLTLQPLEIETGISTFDLTLALAEDQNGLSGGFEYNSDLFDEATIQRMASHLETMLRGILADPDQRVSSLPLMPSGEHRQVLELSRGPRMAYPTQLCLHQLFEAQAARTPQHVAVVMPGANTAVAQEITYCELNTRANRLAYILQGLEVKPASAPVGLFVERSFDMLTGMLGILKAGGAYLPLDPAYPAERLEFILRDAAIELVLTQSGLKRQLPPGNYQVICLDTDWEQIAPLPEKQPECSARQCLAASAADLAYVIYTSGSTGQPKGVMVPHRAVVNHNLNAVDCFQLTPRDRVLQFMSISFDAAIEEIFPTWAAGATLVLRGAPSGAHGDELPTGESLNAMIEGQALTVLDLPTAYWHEWVYELALSGAVLPACLRLVIIGGEKASSERLAAWQKAVGGAGITLLNTYGPTEGTIIDTIYEVTPGSPTWEASTEVPIGRPIANVDTYILDAHLQLMPLGIAGELHIGGDAVAAGYLNRPELTEQRFIPDPFNPTDRHARLYKTGDRARLLPDGNIQFLGRHDHQVKIRGYRVELGEIEAQIEQFPGIRQAAVIAWEAGGAARGAHLRLVAWIVWESQAPDLEGLRQFLRSRLPDYMLPSHYLELDSLPFTATGKIDRNQLTDRLASEPVTAGFDGEDRALQAERSDGTELAGGEIPPASFTVETQLAEIWQQVLGLEQLKGISTLSRHQNFFELGGDSILAIQVIARAAQAGLHLTPRQFFENPTLTGLASVATKLSAPAGKQDEQDTIAGPIPLTPIQRWFFEQKMPEPNHWNQALLLEAVRPLDRKTLEQAASVLLDHHAALRLRFQQDESGWHALQQEAAGVSSLVWINLAQEMAVEAPSGSSAGDEGMRIREQAESLQSSLDLCSGPLFRIAYLDLGLAKNPRLMVVAHHLIMDGISWRILLDDLQTAYTYLSQGMDVQQCSQHMSLRTSSYARWALRLAEFARSRAMDDELAYWHTFSRQLAARLANSPAYIRIPCDYQNGPNDVASAEDVFISLSASETEALLHDTPAAYRTNPQDIMLTALAQAFNRWAGLSQLYLELEGHGREDLFEDFDVSRTIGWFTTIYPVLLDLRGTTWPDKALVAVKETLRQIPRRGIGYGLLRCRRDLLPGLLPVHEPQVSFNYLGQFDAVLKAQHLFKPAQESRGSDRGMSNPRGCIFEITAGVFDGCLQVRWSFSRNLHRRITVEALAGNMLTAVREIIQHCTSRQAGSYTPSDFQMAGLDQHRLDKLLTRMGKQEGE